MACLIVPGAEALVISGIRAAMKWRRAHSGIEPENARPALVTEEELGWLSSLLWGGTALLFIEHMWHGEIVPWFPFLTAMSNPEDTAAMLHEIATVGTAMAILVSVVWVGIVAFVRIHSTRQSGRTSREVVAQ
ncbi:MAG: hypothetical protein Q4C87_06250 [Actinomycetaceae bacterium]|nr:hypothetical protein [Actinomycetaceae bacterium]